MATMKFCDRCNCDITRDQADRVIKVSEGNIGNSSKEYDLCILCLTNFRVVWMQNALSE